MVVVDVGGCCVVLCVFGACVRGLLCTYPQHPPPPPQKNKTKAFTKVTQLEPENGEAWNNLAAVHLRAERWAPAFSALSQAVKLKKGSWQTWHNYAQAALAVGEGASAARGVAAVVELTDGQGVADGALLLELARFAADASSSSSSSAAAVAETTTTTTQETREVPESGERGEREVSGGEAEEEGEGDDDMAVDLSN